MHIQVQNIKRTEFNRRPLDVIEMGNMGLFLEKHKYLIVIKQSIDNCKFPKYEVEIPRRPEKTNYRLSEYGKRNFKSSSGKAIYRERLIGILLHYQRSYTYTHKNCQYIFFTSLKTNAKTRTRKQNIMYKINFKKNT